MSPGGRTLPPSRHGLRGIGTISLWHFFRSGTGDGVTLTERFDALPEPIQEHLMGLVTIAAGMSKDEKLSARIFFDTFCQGVREESEGSESTDELHLAAGMVGGCGRLVADVDALSGDQVSLWHVAVGR